MGDHHSWTGGRHLAKGSGYVMVKLSKDDPFYPMTGAHGYVREHRLVMAKKLGRCLYSWEIVHHENRIRSDNRIENLVIATDMEHKHQTFLETRIQHLEERVIGLEIENALLKGQLQFWLPNGITKGAS